MIVSDRQKKLLATLAQVINTALHAHCMTYSDTNLRQKFKEYRAFRATIWNAAKTLVESKLDKVMIFVREINKEVHGYTVAAFVRSRTMLKSPKF